MSFIFEIALSAPRPFLEGCRDTWNKPKLNTMGPKSLLATFKKIIYPLKIIRPAILLKIRYLTPLLFCISSKLTYKKCLAKKEERQEKRSKRRQLFLVIFLKVHIFWEGHKILQNLPLTFDCMYCMQKLGEDFAKFCGLLRIDELYRSSTLRNLFFSTSAPKKLIQISKYCFLILSAFKFGSRGKKWLPSKVLL